MFRRLCAITKSIKPFVSIKVNNYPFYKCFQKPSINVRFVSSVVNINSPKDVTYSEVKSISNEKTKDKFIIDVRQPEELEETGVIPGSINVPLDQLEISLKQLSDEEFKMKYGLRKPKKDSLIIFSCKIGRRSGEAQTIAEHLGYKNTKNYTGGWTDWEEHLKK